MTKSGAASSEKKTKAESKSELPVVSFNEDQYEYKDNEFDQIRQCLGVYVGTGGQSGAIHLLNEIMTNSIDELTGVNSIGHNIYFYFFEKECRFVVEDDGRGIPLDILYSVIEKKHYSTKFKREFNKYSGGQNGVGTTITAALSDSFSITSTRNGETRTVFMEGNELKDGGLKKAKPEKHGTRTDFIPSKKWLGSFTIEIADVEDYLRRLSYILPDGIVLKTMLTNKAGKETVKTLRRQGLPACVEYMSQSLEFPPVLLSIPEQIIPMDDEDDQYFTLSFAFSYDRTLDDMLSSSFCDYVATKEGGTHEQVVQQCISAFFVKQAKALDSNAKYEVSTDDCKKGLIFAVNCDHSNPKFEGQHKSKVDQKNILQYGRKPITDALTAFFETNNGLLRRIVQYLRQISKIRQEAHKIKNTQLKRPQTFLDDAEIGKIFINISDRNYTGYKELILAEGDSAISAVSSARNSACQAVFAITGVVANTINMSLQQVKENTTFAALIKVLGCGIGPDFDINKLKWNAIIIATDGDVDGSFIASLLYLFFAVHMPQIILSGYLYRVVPPLYRIDTKAAKKYLDSKNYVFDKIEYYHAYHKAIADNMMVSIVEPKTKKDMISGHGTVTELNRKQLIKALDATVSYLDELKTLSKRSACIMEVLEPICYFMLMSNGDRAMFDEMLQKKFPELHYDSVYESIIGAYHGQSVTLIIDKIFSKMATRMIRLMREAPMFYLLAKNKNVTKDDPKADDWDLMTLGQFLLMCEKSFQLSIEQRYKGLGESDAQMIFWSMINPKARKLLRITMNDVAKCMEVMTMLHGESAEMRSARNKMLSDADITLQDIDN